MAISTNTDLKEVICDHLADLAVLPNPPNAMEGDQRSL